MNSLRKMMTAAKILSSIFMPLYLPLVGMTLLFVFTYLSILPWKYKLVILGVVYLLTILLPRLLVRLYVHYMGIHPIHLLQREQRAIPYTITLACYLLCYYVMTMAHLPHLITGVAMAALAIEAVCAALNSFTKISTHMAGIGGVAGGLQAFSIIFGFNPVWWICITLIVAGLVGTSRMILRQHSLGQVVSGFLVGVITAFIVVIFT